jgi:phage terminase large subunit-like protein
MKEDFEFQEYEDESEGDFEDFEDDELYPENEELEEETEDFEELHEEEELDELSKEFVLALIDKIMQFMALLTGHELHPYQKPLAKRIIESVLINDGEEITALASRQSGKSETVANTVATLMVLLPRLAKMYPELLGKFQDGVWVGMFAPIQAQVETLFSRTVSRLTSERAMEVLGDPEIDDTPTKTPGVVRNIKLKNSGSTLMMMTANPRAKIESKSFHLIVIDECQEADDFIVSKSISPMGAYYNATMVKTGTPTTHKNNFYRSIQLNKRRQNAGRNARQNHFQWDWRCCKI